MHILSKYFFAQQKSHTKVAVFLGFKRAAIYWQRRVAQNTKRKRHAGVKYKAIFQNENLVYLFVF